MIRKNIILILLFILPAAGLAAQTLGDVNNSGDIDIIDALMTAQYYVGLEPEGMDTANADVDCSDIIDIIDALQIAQYYVRLINEFSCTPEKTTPPPSTPTPQSGINLVPNPGLEDGTVDGWFPFGETNKIEATTEDSHSGEYSCLATQRTEEWMGPGIDLLGILEDGKSYKISLWAKLANGSEANLKMTVKVVDGNGEENYSPIVSSTVTTASWKELTGIYSHSVAGTPTEVSLYLEDINPSINFYADDASVVEVSGDWKGDADTRIEEIRKRDILLTIVDSTGARVDNASIDIDQTRHAFAFGTAIASDLNSNSRYRSFFRDNFEWAVFENESKWYSNETSKGNVSYATADQMYQYCEENDILVRGHCIFWAVDQYVPSWVTGLTGSALRSAVEDRLESVVKHFDGQFVHWDVNNEMLHGTFFKDRLGSSIRTWMYEETHRLVPDVMLFVNDYNVVSQGETGLYVDQIRELLDDGAPIHGIGVQCHFEGDVMPLSIYDRIEQLAQFNLPIWCSEFDVTEPDEDLRADKLEAFYRTAFSHPMVDGIIMWGFWAGRHWRGAEAAIVDQDWTVNAAGERYFDLIDEWTTHTSGTVSNGTYSFRGFHGKYEATVTTSGGITTQVPFTLEQGAGTAALTLRINETATPSPTPPPTPVGGINTGIDALYRCGERNTVTSQIKPQFNIANNGSKSVSLRDLTVRYYYTREGDMDEEFHIDYAQLGSSNITGTFHDGYVEIGFTTGAGELAPGAETGGIQIRINQMDWSSYDQADDYSFDPSVSAFSLYDKITLYHGGVLISGTPPY